MDSTTEFTCPHARECSGCTLGHLPYSAQLAAKLERVRASFRRYPQLAHTPAEIVGAPRQIGYRLRTKYVADGNVLGLYARGTHRVVDVPQCQVQSPRLAQVAERLRRVLPELNLALAGLDLREVDAGVLATLIVPPHVTDEQLAAARDRVTAAVPEIVGLASSRRQPDAPQLLGHSLRVWSGPDGHKHELPAGAPWTYAAHGAFTQVHADQVATLHRAIETQIERKLGSLERASVLELYAGSGALSLRLAARGASVTAVESFTPATTRLEQAAREQHLPLQVYGQDARGALAGVLREARFDAVLVNPPRRGLERAVRCAIAGLHARLLVYVSCSPETLARDLAHLAHLGWAVREVLAIDMIPLSDAVEVFTVLEPAQPPPVRMLHQTDAWLAVDKPAHISPAGLLRRVQQLPGLEHASAPLTLPLLLSGVSLLHTSARSVDSVTIACEASVSRYIALAKGVVRSKGTIRRAPGRASNLETRYVRRRVIAGHSLVDVTSASTDPGVVLWQLAEIGHPVLGDAKHGDAATCRYFEKRHGLDRPFLHRSALTLRWMGQDVTLESQLAGDLDAVLASMAAKPSPDAD